MKTINGKKVKNPLLEMTSLESIEKMFGKDLAANIVSKPVFKYTHKGLGEGLGDQRFLSK